MNSDKYFENRDCRYFPCHKTAENGSFNCLFCFCPLYPRDDCPGNHSYKEKNGKKIKVCINCTFPHEEKNYERILELLKE